MTDEKKSWQGFEPTRVMKPTRIDVPVAMRIDSVHASCPRCAHDMVHVVVCERCEGAARASTGEPSREDTITAIVLLLESMNTLTKRARAATDPDDRAFDEQSYEACRRVVLWLQRRESRC